MSARDPAPMWAAQDATNQHDMRIHRARQLSRPVLHAGVKKFIAGFCLHKGDEEMTIYLEGSPDPVRPCDITILEQTNGE